jgi:hypothetical protein
MVIVVIWREKVSKSDEKQSFKKDRNYLSPLIIIKRFSMKSLFLAISRSSLNKNDLTVNDYETKKI